MIVEPVSDLCKGQGYLFLNIRVLVILDDKGHQNSEALYLRKEVPKIIEIQDGGRTSTVENQ